MKSNARSFHLKSRFSRLFCCAFVALTLLVWPFGVLAEEAGAAAAPSASLSIETPSEAETTIAPGRSFMFSAASKTEAVCQMTLS